MKFNSTGPEVDNAAQEAADAVKAFRPKIVYPLHYRQTDAKLLADALEGTGIDVWLRN